MNTAINGLGKNFLSAGNFDVDRARSLVTHSKNLGEKISTGFENLGGHISSGVSDIVKGLENVGKMIGAVVWAKMLCFLFVSTKLQSYCAYTFFNVRRNLLYRHVAYFKFNKTIFKLHTLID